MFDDSFWASTVVVDRCQALGGSTLIIEHEEEREMLGGGSGGEV